MKTAIVHLNNVFYRFNDDEWDSFRSEGRIPLNIGFGLTLLGYDVNIVYEGWTSLNEPKKTWNNIMLSKVPLRDYYDIALSFSSFSYLLLMAPKLKFGKGISMIYEKSHILRTKEFIRKTGIEVKYAYIYKDTLDNIKEIIKKDTGTDTNVYFLPMLFPIPSINIGFLPCSYSPKLPELKLYLHYTGWPQNTTISGNRFTHKEQLTIDYLRTKGYKIKLSILVENKEATGKCPIKNDNITFYHSNESSHADIIKLIQSADICMTHGAPVFPGNGLTDIISLGKPLIYMADGRLGIEWRQQFTSILYRCPDNLVYIQESDSESMRKIDIIMDNTIDLCKTYANVYDECNFNTWKNIVKDIF